MSGGAQPVAPAGLTLTVGPAPGKMALTVEGRAPAYAQVTIVLKGTLSKDLPDVFLTRRDITADEGGRFSTIVSIAPEFWRGSLVTISANSAETASTATAHFTVDLPNPGVVLPADDVPNH
jgi:hypothetical protein